jgi:hypothetical protein
MITAMVRKRFLLLAAVLVVANVSLWLVQGGFALPQALIDRFFGPRLVRAEVILAGQAGAADDFRIDRGVITSTSPGSLVLQERDGTVVTIPVARGARVLGSALVRNVSQLRPPMRVLVVRKATAPANLIEVEGRG